MINEQLLQYIKREVGLNVSKDAIVANLKSQGWTGADIAEAFTALSNVPQPSSPLPQSESKGSNKLISILVVGFLVVGGAAYGYFSGMFVSLPSLQPSILDGLRNAKGMVYDTTLSVDFPASKQGGDIIGQIFSGNLGGGQLRLTSNGSYDASSPQNKKTQMLMEVNAGPVSLKVETKTLDGVAYVRLVKSPELAFLPMLASYEDKWYSFPYKNEDGQTPGNPLSLSFVGGGVMNKLTEEQKENMYKITKEARFIKTTKKLAPEVISGESSYHFLFDLDREGIVSYLQSLRDYINSEGKDDSVMSSFDPTDFKEQLDKIQNFSGEVWIGRKDRLPRKVSLSFGINPEYAEGEENVKVNIVSIFRDWNKPSTIVAPEKSIPFQDLMKEFFGAVSSEQNELKGEAEIKSHFANLRAEAEIFYDANYSYKGFCSSSDYNDVKTKVKNAGAKEFFCSSIQDKYAVSVKIPEKESYWCVDSTGFWGETSTLPISAICPKPPALSY